MTLDERSSGGGF